MLIASENFTSNSALEALNSAFTHTNRPSNNGSETLANDYTHEIEDICRKRALQAFNLSKSEWDATPNGVTGSPANLFVYHGLL